MKLKKPGTDQAQLGPKAQRVSLGDCFSPSFALLSSIVTLFLIRLCPLNNKLAPRSFRLTYYLFSNYLWREYLFLTNFNKSHKAKSARSALGRSPSPLGHMLLGDMWWWGRPTQEEERGPTPPELHDLRIRLPTKKSDCDHQNKRKWMLGWHKQYLFYYPYPQELLATSGSKI